MRRKFLLLLFASAACLLCADGALGCMCSYPQSACDARQVAQAAFVGTVTAKTPLRQREGNGDGGWFLGQIVYTFKVEEAFHGTRRGSAKVQTGLGGGDCGYVFEVGQRYLVYAHAMAPDGILRTSICSRTSLAADAAGDLKILRDLAAGVNVYGEVRRFARPEASQARDGTPVPGVTLFVTSGGRRVEVRTDAGGKFRVKGLPPGNVTAWLKPPAGLRAQQKELTKRADDRGCAYFHFALYAEGSAGQSL